MDNDPNELDARKQSFLGEYKQLIDKYHLDFMTTPRYVMNDRGTWELVNHTELVDTTEHPVPSPFSV